MLESENSDFRFINDMKIIYTFEIVRVDIHIRICHAASHICQIIFVYTINC